MDENDRLPFFTLPTVAIILSRMMLFRYTHLKAENVVSKLAKYRFFLIITIF